MSELCGSISSANVFKGGGKLTDFGYPDAQYAVTDFSVRCGVLGSMFIDRESILDTWNDLTGLDQFIEYFDLALPLAYAIANQIIEPSLGAKKLIDEAWDDFMGRT